jgi:protein-S-isoprenylcysteine O-methyltransferase Ste14
MWELYSTCAALVVAVAINSTSVYIQKQYKFYTRTFGSNGQIIHSFIIVPFWIIFIIFASQLQLNLLFQYTFTNLWIVGLLLLLTAVSLFVSAIKIIGNGALTNSNFFTPQKKVISGVYRYFKNPMYDSYALFFLGLGLIFSNWSYIILSVLVWILLNCIESKVENF